MGEVERKARVAGLVRLGRRAGRILVGVELTRQAIRAGDAAVVLLADDLAAGRRDRLMERCREAEIPVSHGWTKEELGEIAGRPAVAVLSVTDRNMAAGIAAIESASRSESTEK